MSVKKTKSNKPKVGDRVSLKVIGYGLVSYEDSKIKKIKGNKIWIEGRDSMPVIFPSGIGENVLGLRIDVVFDGGKACDEYEKTNG